MQVYFFVGIVVFCFLGLAYFLLDKKQKEFNREMKEDKIVYTFLVRNFTNNENLPVIFSRILKDYLKGEEIPQLFLIFVCEKVFDYELMMEIIAEEKDRSTSSQDIVKLVLLQNRLEKVNRDGEFEKDRLDNYSTQPRQGPPGSIIEM